MMKIFFALLLITFIQSDDTYDETRVYNAIMALQSKYPQGTPWTNSNSYVWTQSVAIGLGYSRYTGSGCVAFAMIASDAAFGNIPAYKKTDKAGIKVGDILRINNDTHSVIVLKKEGNDRYTIAEGNYNSSINWGRVINLGSTGFSYRITRYKS